MVGVKVESIGVDVPDGAVVDNPPQAQTPSVPKGSEVKENV